VALNDVSDIPRREPLIGRTLTVVCAVLVVAFLLMPPLAPLDKTRLVGYTICHQIPDRSFHILGRQLPLCARCTGTYLGVTIGFAALALLRRWRTSEMLPTGTIVLMVAFIGIMGLDGLNSYLSLFEGMPTLYTPHNWLRAATGGLNGIALTLIVWPVFNYTLWRHPSPERPLKNLWELLAIVAATGGAVALVQSEPGWLLYPVAIVSAGGVLWMLTLVNTMIILILFRRDSQAETWRDAASSLLLGLVAALIELTAMGVLRYLVTGTMGWPLIS
jgi:uncharacterized membrane protein